jgi:signal transduction histidine kinase
LTTSVLRDLTADNLSVDGAESTQAIKTIEIEALAQSAATLPVEISAGRLQISDKPIYLLTITDISARKELQLAKQEFIGMISEDLATPLSSVHDFLKVLTADTNLTQNGHDRAVLAVNNVGRLLRLLDDLFEINELESGQLELKPSMVSIQEIVDRAIDAVRVFAEKHKVTLESNQASSRIFADGDRLERVLVNLLSNAIKFSPEGAMVSVSITESEHLLQIKVIDHGRGIPASHLSSVFTAFKQVTSSDATKKGGTGLGLAICKAVIEQHGGSIGVDSVEGEGSTFWFELPLEPPVSEIATT